MKRCKKCGGEYVTLVKEAGNKLIHKRIQKDKHDVEPDDSREADLLG